MAAPEQLEPQPTEKTALKAALVELQTQLNALKTLSPDAPKENVREADLASDTELALLETQLKTMETQAAAIDSEATRLQEESSGNESTEVEQARQQAQDMRGAAKEARAVISASSTDPKTGKKRISASQVTAFLGMVGRVIGAANNETSDLGQATTEARMHNAEAREALSEKAATTGPTHRWGRVRRRVMKGEEKEEKGEDVAPPRIHKPLMDAHEQRNHDGHVSVREAALGTVSLIQAVGSKKKRETLARIAGEVETAVEEGDRRGMLDGALHAGRGVARVTGSDDVGHMATIVIGVTVTKTHTTGKLLSDGDGWGILSAIGRNLDSAISYTTDAVGMNDFADNLRPLLGRLMADTQVDWEHLANEQRVRQFDVDGNGRLDAQEVISVFRNNNVTFEVVDANADDTLSYEEVTAQLRKIALKNNAYSEDQVNNGIFARGAGMKAPLPAHSH